VAVEIVIVGGGVIGCACACELARAGHDVLVLERDGLAAGASGRNQGLLLPGAAPAYQPLFREGVARYAELTDGPVPFGFRPVAQLLLAADAAALQHAERQAAVLGRGGLEATRLEPHELLALEPSLAPDLLGGLRIEGGYVLDPPSATAAWAESARRSGARIRTHDEVHRLVAHRGRVTGVVADSGLVSASTVVSAAGTATRGLVATVGVDLPVSGTRGWLLQTEPLPWTVRHVLQEVTEPGPAEIGSGTSAVTVAALAGGTEGAPAPERDGFALHQAPTGHAVIGASFATALGDGVEYPEAVRGLACRALRYCPGLAGVAVAAAWSGVRPMTPDGLPLVGPVPGVEGLLVAVGHGSHGVMLAPSTARMLGALLAGRARDLVARAFAPDRVVVAGGS
jgi:D-hydroxyproline dehydrogenase subunit beta